MDLDIKQLEQRKRKIEGDLAEVNGQLSSMKKHYADMEKRNTHLRNAFVQKLKFSPQKTVKDKIDNRKSVITPDFEFDEIDSNELVSACVEAEGAKENKVQNVEIVYRRTGCNRWEDMCSRILMSDLVSVDHKVMLLWFSFHLVNIVGITTMIST